MCRLPLLLLVALGAGCTWIHSRDQVLVTSEPLGARIFVDGQDTGRTTPAQLPIAGVFGSDHEIRLTKRGYRPEVRQVYQYTEGYTSKWIDGVFDPTMPALPIFWTGGDFCAPFAIRAAPVPGELHVKLYRDDEPLLGFEVLRQQQTNDAK